MFVCIELWCIVQCTSASALCAVREYESNRDSRAQQPVMFMCKMNSRCMTITHDAVFFFYSFFARFQVLAEQMQSQSNV